MTRFARALIVAMFLLSLVAWGQAPRVVTQEVGEVQVVFFVCSGDGTAALDVVGSLEEAAVPPEDCPDSFAPPDVALEVVDPEAGTPVAELIFDPEIGAVTGTLPPGVYAIRGFEPLTI